MIDSKLQKNMEVQIQQCKYSLAQLKLLLRKSFFRYDNEFFLKIGVKSFFHLRKYITSK